MTRRQRAMGLMVVGALVLLVVILGTIALPLMLDATLAADYSVLPAGTEVVMTKEQFERGQTFPFWGSAFLTALLALAVAIFLVALTWSRAQRGVPTGPLPF
ncbi:hypothetical protein ELQ90_02640 [Labedella phragmitis]|uniref:Uncharacterized protein n=1 Tax=Labedella phragmitis TaxID=2498849 RepID=A0A3S3ZD20_9MICO|nr:hypothetical protein [Labedella phragmitis]RWZ52856.1 hypothetical protein ELQ90_02640 [Labedella phragmitis]